MVDQVPDNLWVKDLKSRFVIVNKATAQRMGGRVRICFCSTILGRLPRRIQLQPTGSVAGERRRD
jgi:hypothetical protein